MDVSVLILPLRADSPVVPLILPWQACGSPHTFLPFRSLRVSAAYCLLRALIQAATAIIGVFYGTVRHCGVTLSMTALSASILVGVVEHLIDFLHCKGKADRTRPRISLRKNGLKATKWFQIHNHKPLLTHSNAYLFKKSCTFAPK